MAAANTDSFKKLTNNFSTTLNGAIVGAGDTSGSLSSTTNLPTDTGIVLVVDRVNASGVATPTLREYIKGTVSGSTIINLVRGIGNSTAQAHLSGAIVEQVVDQTTWNDAMTGILAHANQDGTLITSAVQNALGLTNLNGYTPVGYTPNTVTANGNRSYNMVFNGQDLTTFLSPGIRLRTTRTVPAPTKCANLNGTTQYFNNVAPAGMTFTNNFVVSAWVKLSSYAGTAIASRYDGNNGWQLQLNSSGQVKLSGYNGGAGSNNSEVTSYQSIPLNKWVHIAAQLDMSAFTATTTTSYIMIDGVDVPALVSRGGTNPTSLVQAGTLNVGALNGANFFPGKIAQVAIYSAKVTQATILASISQGLAGTETSLISAYSLSGATGANDLNTTNANNLTANGSATTTNADSPFGGQASGLISSTLDYGIIQSVSFSTNTTVVVQVPEGCTIPTSGGVSAVVYSSNKVPYGFPGQEGKWSMDVLGRSQVSQAAPVGATWYQIGSIQLNVPIGEWVLAYWVEAQQNGTSGSGDVYTTLATSTAAQTDTAFTCSTTATSSTIAGQFTKSGYVSLVAAQTYYLNSQIGTALAANTLYNRGDASVTIVRARNAHL